jgi:hypothetical protein
MKNNNLREMFGNTTDGTHPGSVNRILRLVTGWALVAAAAGTIYDAYACDGCSQGSIGLIPIYLGFPIASVGLVIIFKKVGGWIAATFAAVGLAGILYFMFAYPNGVNGWIGGILLGMAHLFLPLSGRFASVLWVAVGIFGFPYFGMMRALAPVPVFLLFGVATAATGLFVLLGLKSANSVTIQEEI